MSSAHNGSAKRYGPHDKVNILGTELNAITFREARGILDQVVRDHSARIFRAVNVYTVMLGYDDPSFQTIINQADFVLPDGMPLVWVSRWMGYTGVERVHGDDFMLASIADNPEWKHFLIGGRIGQGRKVIKTLKDRFPRIQILGAHETPQRPLLDRESDALLEEIVTSNPDILWVGMGTPYQDYWMQRNKEHIDCPMFGVGSSFDILAGYTRPTPAWIKQVGLQWMFRLVQEPRRLFWRYFFYNPRFIFAILRQLSGTARHG